MPHIFPPPPSFDRIEVDCLQLGQWQWCEQMQRRKVSKEYNLELLSILNQFGKTIPCRQASSRFSRGLENLVSSYVRTNYRELQCRVSFNCKIFFLKIDQLRQDTGNIHLISSSTPIVISCSLTVVSIS